MRPKQSSSTTRTCRQSRRCAMQSRRVLRRQRGAVIIAGATGSTTLVFLTAGAALALGLGGYLFTTGAITLGTVYLIFSYTELLRRPVEQRRGLCMVRRRRFRGQHGGHHEAIKQTGIAGAQI